MAKSTKKKPETDPKDLQAPPDVHGRLWNELYGASPCPPRVKLKVPVEAAENEIKRLYGVTKTATANVMLAMLTEMVWARLTREANDE